MDRHKRLFEMATVGSYRGRRVVTYPSADPESPGRREHGPPHFILFIPGQEGVKFLHSDQSRPAILMYLKEK